MSAKAEGPLSTAPTKAHTDQRAIARVHTNHRDMVMTWEEITEELIWDEYDPEGPEHQLISPERLESFCKRFPHFEERLRWYASQWNRPDGPLTEEELAAVEVKPEQIERSMRFAFWAMRFHDKLHRVEADRDELSAALRGLYDAAQRGDFDHVGPSKSAACIATRQVLAKHGDIFDQFDARTQPSTRAHDVAGT